GRRRGRPGDHFDTDDTKMMASDIGKIRRTFNVASSARSCADQIKETDHDDRNGDDPLGSGPLHRAHAGDVFPIHQREWARLERSLSKSCGLRPPRSVRGDERDLTYGE